MKEELTASNNQLAESKSQLAERDNQLAASIKMLSSAGILPEQIAQNLKISIEKVKDFLQ